MKKGERNMATSLRIFSIVLFVFLMCQQGYSYKCGLKNIKVTTKRTGTTIEGQPQYAVTVTNNCPCAQSRVYLRCLGFSSVQPINPGIFKVKGDSCLINNGRPIALGKSVSFKYSFLQPTDLVPQRSEITC